MACSALAEESSPTLALSIAAMPAESAGASSDLEYWRERARLIPAGTRRADVERLLPEYKSTPPLLTAGRLALSNGVSISILSATPAPILAIGPGWIINAVQTVHLDCAPRTAIRSSLHQIENYSVAPGIVVSMGYQLKEPARVFAVESPDDRTLGAVTVMLRPRVLPVSLLMTNSRLDLPVDLFGTHPPAPLTPGVTTGSTRLPANSGPRFNFNIGYQF